MVNHRISKTSKLDFKIEKKNSFDETRYTYQKYLLNKLKEVSHTLIIIGYSIFYCP